jgi:flavodoxin
LKAVILFDSQYGNTGQIAQLIAQTLRKYCSVSQEPVDRFSPDSVGGSDLLIVGSPTQGGQPTKRLQEKLAQLPDLQGKSVAVFDTRFAKDAHGTFLKLLMKTIGFAAPKLARALQRKGGSLVVPAEGFIVGDKFGPLAIGEIERAEAWADRIGKNIKTKELQYEY